MIGLQQHLFLPSLLEPLLQQWQGYSSTTLWVFFHRW